MTDARKIPKATYFRGTAATCLTCRAEWTHGWALATAATNARVHSHDVRGGKVAGLSLAGRL